MSRRVDDWADDEESGYDASGYDEAEYDDEGPSDADVARFGDDAYGSEDETDSAHCRNCGSTIYADAPRCPNCGLWITRSEIGPKRGSGWLIGRIAVAVIASLLIISLVCR